MHWIITHQLSLFGWQRWRWDDFVYRVRAAVGIVEAVNLLKALVPPLLVNTLALRRLIEDGRLWFWIILHKLHVLQNYREKTWLNVWKKRHLLLYHNKKNTIFTVYTIGQKFGIFSYSVCPSSLVVAAGCRGQYTVRARLRRWPVVGATPASSAGTAAWAAPLLIGYRSVMGGARKEGTPIWLVQTVASSAGGRVEARYWSIRVWGAGSSTPGKPDWWRERWNAGERGHGRGLTTETPRGILGGGSDCCQCWWETVKGQIRTDPDVGSRNQDRIPL